MKFINTSQRKLEDEEQLIIKCRSGNNSARRDLYIKYSKRLLSVCYRYAGDIDLAHDLLHDGFIKIYMMIKSFEWRGEGSLELWMRRVVANICLDYLNAQKKRNEFVLDETQVQEDILDEATLDDEDKAQQLSQEQLLSFIAELPNGYRMVFNLFVFEKKTHREIAELLGINVSSSTSQLSRAKNMLAKRINDFIKENEERERSNNKSVCFSPRKK